MNSATSFILREIIFGGGSTTGGGLIIDPGGPSRPGSNSIPGVKCYCQESILVRINIDVKEFKDRINPKSLFKFPEQLK